MSRPYLQYRSIWELARAMGLSRRDVERAIDRLERDKREVTEDAIRAGVAAIVRSPRGERVGVLGHPSVPLAAQAHGINAATLYQRIYAARRRNQPLDVATLIDAYARSPRAAVVWSQVTAWAGRLIEQCPAVVARRAA